MPVEIITAIIGGVAVVIAAIITAILKNRKRKESNDIPKHGNSVSAGRDIIGTTINQNDKSH